LAQADAKKVGWIGAGRMGVALAERLLRSGHDVAVYNRTRAKAEPLGALGAAVVNSPADLADRAVVFTMVASTDALLDVTQDPNGLFHGGRGPALLVDCSTVSIEGSEEVRQHADRVGTRMVAAPVSGNPKVARNGMLTLVASGPREAFDEALPYLEVLGRGVTYVGEGDAARLVKIAHNLLLGTVAQSLAEITVLAERGGIARSDLLAFINDSVMGSIFTRYKTPAFVNLDFHPTFTGHLLRKDFELGLEAGRRHGVPLPVTSAAHKVVTELTESGRGDDDFATLLLLEAAGAGMTLEPEDVPVDDGLHPIDELARAAMEER
jgi:3-hydroxyisobutyrate dehydrogenase-like beta-hydroxyacid dehydrogenase